jgi:Domain of unknown function (DUF4388)
MMVSLCKITSVNMIRNFLFILIVALCLPLQAAAALTFGVVPHSGSLIRTKQQAVQFAAALQTALGEEVKVRIFAEEATLHTWLNRYQQVDLAVLTRNYLKQQPAGEFFVLRGTESFGSRDPFVLRQGVTKRKQIKVQSTLSSLAATPKVRKIFRKSPPPPAKPKPATTKLVKKRLAATPRPKPAAKRIEKTVAATPPTMATSEPISTEPQGTAPSVPTGQRISLKPSPAKTALTPGLAGEPQEKIPGKVNIGPVSQYSQPNPTQPTATISRDSGNQWVWFGALIVAAAFAAFLFLRSGRRQSSLLTTRLRTSQPAPNPIIDNRAATQKSEPNHNKQGRRVTRARPGKRLPITPMQAFRAELVGVESSIPASAPAGAKLLPQGKKSSDPDAKSADNAKVVIEEQVSPSLDIEFEPIMKPTVDPCSEAPLDMNFIKTSESIEDEELRETRVDTEKSFSEDPAEVTTTSAESVFPAQVDESPESPESSPREKATEVRDFKYLPTDGPFEPKDVPDVPSPQATETSEGLQDDSPGGDLSDPPEGSKSVDFSRESVVDIKPSTETLAAGRFSPAEDHLPQNKFPMEDVQDNGLHPFSSDENNKLEAIEPSDYSKFFGKEQKKDSHATPLKKEDPRLLPPKKQPISLRIRGELGSSQVPALLKLISSQKKPGTLIVHTRQGEKRFYFRKGKLSRATSIPLTDGREHNDVVVSNLGQLLVRQGLLSEEQRTQALEECKQHPLQQLDVALCTAGSLPRETVKQALSGLITELVFSLILFPKGRFEYLAQKSPIPLQEDLGIDINTILKEASQQTVEWHELRKTLPTLDTVMDFRPNGQKKIQNAKMPRHQKHILDLIDGKRTIQNISDQAHMTEFEVCKFLFVMDKARIISPAK